MSSQYKIVDEPKPSFHHWLIVNPVVILFAAILVPIFMELPYSGKFWMPFLWLVINSMLLGSATKFMEIFLSIIGVLMIAALIGITLMVFRENPELARSLMPYLRILANAMLFLMLYVVVLKQSESYGVFDYLRSLNEDG